MVTKVITDNTTGGDYTGTAGVKLQEDAPTTNQSSLSFFETFSFASGDRGHSLLKFSGLSNISGPVTVNSVTLEVYQVSSTAGTRTMELYRVLRDWSETQCTWNVYSTGNNWSSAGCLGAGTDKSTTLSGSFSVTETNNEYKSWGSAQMAQDVQDWINGVNPNYGWVIIRNPDNAFDATVNRWRDKDDIDGTRPKLTVVYSVGVPASYPLRSDNYF